MKAKQETIAFKCSPHQAHLLRRYAKSIMTAEVNLENEIHRRAAHYAMLQKQNLADFHLQQQAAQAAQQQALGAAAGGGLASLLGGLGRII